MATANDVLRIAAGEIGYNRWNDPQQGTKYGRWLAQVTNTPYFGASGVPYCAMFVAWVLNQAGQKVPSMPTASCGAFERGAQSIKIANKRDARAGDIVLFDWPNVAGGHDHIGFVEVNKGGHIQTIEGNTSSGSSGSQGNGGGVYRRTRGWSVVQAVYRPAYSGSMPAPSPTPSAGLAVDGIWGRATTLRIQEVLGAPYRDGEISRQNSAWKSISRGCGTGWQWVAGGEEPGSQTIKLMQQRIGATPDGFVGPNTWNCLIRHFKAASGATELDGRIDCPSITVKAMQRALNEGRF